MVQPAKQDDLRSARLAYRTAYEDYVVSLDEAVRISVELNGTPSSHGRQYWSSVIFTKLVVSGMSIRRLVPPGTPIRADELWDLASAACLARAFAENVLTLQWLCGDDLGEDVWQFRIIAMQIMDNRARFRMIHEPFGTAEPEDFLRAQASLESKISCTDYFKTLPLKRQAEILKGNKSPFIHDDVLYSLSFDRASFRAFYRYLSAFVHTGTISFWRMSDAGRGDGSDNLYDIQAITAILQFCSELNESAKKIIRGVHA